MRYAASAGLKASIERWVRNIAPRVNPDPQAIFCNLYLFGPSQRCRNKLRGSVRTSPNDNKS
jgi:hypothetical protein